MMMRLFFSSACAIAERRLCRQMSAPSSGPVPGMVERGTSVAADWTLWLTGKGINLGSQMKEGLVYAWNKDARSEELKNAEMQQTGEFMQYAPKNILELLQNRFESCLAKGERPTLTQIAALTSLPNWIDAFGDTTLFEEPTVLQESTLFTGPAGLLWSVDVPTRKVLFHDLVTEKLLPGGAQAGFEGTFGALTLKKEESAEYMTHPDNQATIVSALQGMMGKDIPAGGMEEQIAKRALQHRYYVDGKFDPTGAAPLENLHANLVRGDLRNLVRGGNIRTPDDIKTQAGRSFLAGAAKLGVLPDDVLSLPLEEQRIKSHRMIEDVNEKTQRLNKLTGAIDKKLRSETKNFGTIWREMPPLVRMALPIIGIWALIKSKTARGVGAGIAAYYVGAKFIAKMDNPWMPLQRMVDQSQGMLTGVLPEWFAPEKIQDIDTQTIMRRQGIAETFLDETLREDLNTSSEVINLLFDVPVASIAQFLEIPPGTSFTPGAKARLKVWDPDFQRMMRDHVKKKGMKASVVADILGPSGAPGEADSSPARAAQARVALDMGNALSTMMYLKGGKSGDPRMSQVEEAVSRYTTLGKYDQLPPGEREIAGGVFVDPQRLYCELRAEGMRETLGDLSGQILGDFIVENLRISEAPDTKGKVEIEQGRFLERKAALESYSHLGRPVGLSAVRTGDLVEVGIIEGGVVGVGGTLLTPVKIPLNRFNAMTTMEIGEEYLKVAMPEKMKEIQPVVTRTHALFWSELVGENLRYSEVTPPGVPLAKPIAETSGYEVLVADPNDFNAKFTTWGAMPDRDVWGLNPLRKK